MNFNSLINSRHREQTIKDLLNLGGNVEQDYLSIPQSEKMFSVPSTGDFEFGCDVTMSTNPATSQGLLGYSQFSNSFSRYGLNIGGGGTNITFVTRSSSVISTSITPYLGQRVNIKCGYYDASPQGRIYIDNVLVASVNSVVRPSTPLSTQDFFIGAFGNASGDAPQNNIYFDGKLHSFFIDGETWSFPEGSGFNTVSDLGTTAFGSTSNSGGLAYWNNNVWSS